MIKEAPLLSEREIKAVSLVNPGPKQTFTTPPPGPTGPDWVSASRERILQHTNKDPSKL